MLDLKNRSSVADETFGGNLFSVITLGPNEFENLKVDLINIVPSHYVDPISVARTLQRLGKDAAAQKLIDRIPQTKKIRSGDIGEILATDYVEQYSGFCIPIRKLRWRDHRDMAMRGDDVLGFEFDVQNQSIKFIKVEAKSNMALSNSVLSTAQEELNLNDGLPSPHALSFISERLWESGQTNLSELIEKVQLVDGIKQDQVEHLLFTYTASNPATLQRTALGEYTGEIKQSSIGFRVSEHQELIERVYKGVLDGLNN